MDSQKVSGCDDWDEVEWGKVKLDYPTPFLLDVAVSEQDIDGLQHVNNAVYVGWCQNAGWAHSKALGIGLTDYQALDRAMAIRRSEFDYLQAAYLGDKLKVATWLTGNDNKLSMERRFQLVRASDGATLLRARWDLVCIEISSGRPKRMPALFKETYGAVVIENGAAVIENGTDAIENGAGVAATSSEFNR